MKNILITTDFSKNAIHAADYAINLFQYEACTFYMLHVVKASSFISDDLMNMNPSSSIYSQIIASEKIKLEHEIDQLKNKHNNILHEFIPIVDYDNFIGSINQCVEKNNIELIVMGTKGANNSLKKIFGSNTMRVIRNAQIPVLAIPINYSFKPVHKILFTTNYKNKYKKSELKTLIDLAEHHDYKIHILHMSESNSLSQEAKAVKVDLEGFFTNILHAFVELEDSNFLNPIQNYIENNQIDIFTMMNRDYNFLDKLLSLQKIEKIAYNMTIPFLALQVSD
jgi:nucleotide-binding universal stress UspA family protein